MNLYRHVCFKDLEDYVRRDDYFKSYSDLEKELVKYNLGLGTAALWNERTYKEVCELVKEEDLFPGALYVITDYKTIYRTLDDEKTVHVPEEVMPIIVQATGNASISPVAYVLNADILISYTLTPKKLTDKAGNVTETMGQITHMIDGNGNEAPYDFKTVRWYVGNYSTSFGNYIEADYLYTFDDGEGNENSANCTNCKIASGCLRIAIIGESHNLNFQFDCDNIYLLKGGQNSEFEYGSSAVIFNVRINHVISHISTSTITNFIAGGDDVLPDNTPGHLYRIGGEVYYQYFSPEVQTNQTIAVTTLNDNRTI